MADSLSDAISVNPSMNASHKDGPGGRMIGEI